MYIFFPHKKVNDLFYISGEENNHLKVRRIRIGEQIGIIYNERIYKCVLKERGRDISTAQVVEVLAPQKPDIEITLYQSVTVHLATMDLIVQKSVELGVIRFVPLVTERSFRNITVVNRKIPRWERIAREAMKQSGRAYPMEITPALKIEDLRAESQLNLLLDSFYEGKSAAELDFRRVEKVSLAIGPEGGFTKAEADGLRGKGFVSLRLKPHILRAETAAIVAVGIIANLADS